MEKRERKYNSYTFSQAKTGQRNFVNKTLIPKKLLKVVLSTEYCIKRQESCNKIYILQ